MSDKMTCPACDLHTSSVLAAYRQGASCPSCGLPAGAATEILAARRRGADAELTRRVEELMRELAETRDELNRARWRLAQVETALSAEPLGWR